MNFEFYEIGMDNINLVKPLWEKLNAMHQSKSEHFFEWLKNHTFEARLKPLFEKAKKGQVKIEVVKETGLGVNVGYCISYVSDKNEGELESLFIESFCRGQGVGDKLMENALAWMKAKGAKDIEIMVYQGNEDVFKFYGKHGFYPKKHILYRKTGTNARI